MPAKKKATRARVPKNVTVKVPGATVAYSVFVSGGSFFIYNEDEGQEVLEIPVGTLKLLMPAINQVLDGVQN